ncbi:MAG: 1-acyl-sn-glycerol-3-phosphate acyltransferase [Anaeromyxobacteraceae bacterium]
MIAALANWLLRVFGWRTVLVPMPGPKGIIVVYPHTSNWDFPIGYLFKLATGLPLSWVGKDTLFRWPVGGLLRRMGGIAANRRERTGLIGQLVVEFGRRDWMWMAIAPEGTRALAPHWKSGFHRLALAADVPIGLGFIDWGRREVGVCGYVRMTGDREADMARIGAAYAGKVGLRPENAGPIRLGDDDR